MMDTDVILVFGILLAALSIPSMLNAYSSERPLRFGGLLFLVGVVMVTVALVQNPDGYAFDEVPDVFVRVFARLFA
jgi:hypothetical protein